MDWTIFSYEYLKYSWYRENISSSARSFNQYYLSIPQYTGSCGSRFQETNGILM